MAKALTDEQRQLRVDLVVALADFVKGRDNPTQEYVDEATKQIKRIAKFLCVAN